MWILISWLVVQEKVYRYVSADQVDIAMVSRELKPQEKEKGALAYAVAKDAVVATINASNPVYREYLKTGLSQKQATAIWEGKDKDECLAPEAMPVVPLYHWGCVSRKKQEDLKGSSLFPDPGVAGPCKKDVNGNRIRQIGYAYNDKTHKPTRVSPSFR